MDTNTKALWDYVEAGVEQDERPSIPPRFIDGLRQSLEAGLTCEEIVASLILFAGFHEALRRMGGLTATEKALNLVKVMKRDIELSRAEERFEQRNNFQRRT